MCDEARHHSGRRRMHGSGGMARMMGIAALLVVVFLVMTVSHWHTSVLVLASPAPNTAGDTLVDSCYNARRRSSSATVIINNAGSGTLPAGTVAQWGSLGVAPANIAKTSARM